MIVFTSHVCLRIIKKSDYQVVGSYLYWASYIVYSKQAFDYKQQKAEEREDIIKKEKWLL